MGISKELKEQTDWSVGRAEARGGKNIGFWDSPAKQAGREVGRKEREGDKRK